MKNQDVELTVLLGRYYINKPLKEKLNTLKKCSIILIEIAQ